MYKEKNNIFFKLSTTLLLLVVALFLKLFMYEFLCGPYKDFLELNLKTYLISIAFYKITNLGNIGAFHKIATNLIRTTVEMTNNSNFKL